jgi:hypothetical protein
MKSISIIAAAIAMIGGHAAPSLAGGGGRSPQAHGAPMTPPPAHRPVQNGQAHIIYGGPRLDQRPDPNNRSLYRPMFSLNATNPGEPHPYFQTRPDGFGYPAARPAPVYLGNGMYFVPK